MPRLWTNLCGLDAGRAGRWIIDGTCRITGIQSQKSSDGTVVIRHPCNCTPLRNKSREVNHPLLNKEIREEPSIVEHFATITTKRVMTLATERAFKDNLRTIQLSAWQYAKETELSEEITKP